MTYTDVFGNNTLPPSEYGYASFNLTADSTFVWPYNSSNASFTVAKVMDMTCAAGVSLVLPNATEVSAGEDFMMRNVGLETLTIKDASGTQITQVLPGAATYFYLTSNATADGLYGVIAFGVGTSSVDAASLVGYGVKAIGSSLNQSHPVVQTVSSFDLDADYRAKLVVFSGGAATFSLVSAAVLGDDYFTLFRNDGTGTVTLTAYSGDYIDGMASMQVQPGESLILVCTGTQWFTVGYGRSVLYQFTQLTKDVSAGGTITLTAPEASNKLITFVGNPSSAVSVIVPATVAVYYTQSAISTAQTITLKTAGGSGTGITQGARIIALCDGTNVVSAQSAVANASVSLTDGSVSVPSLFFSTQTNTGLYKDGTKSLGVTVEGVSVGVFGPNGLQTATLGPNSTQRHTVPAVPSDTISLLNTAQTVTNKTFNLSNNTLTGTTAQFNTALSDGDFATLAGVETLTNKTLNSPVISNPFGLTKGDVGLGNVDNTSDATKNSSSATLTNKTISVDSNTISGLAVSSFALTNASGNLDGSAAAKAVPAGVVVGTTDTQTLTNKTLTSPVLTTPTLGTPSSGTLTSCTGLPIVDGTTGTLTVGRGGTGATTLTGLAKGNGAAAFTAAVAGTDYLAPTAIGTTVQAYDANTAKTDVAQNFTLPQRSALLTDNDGSFDLAAKQNFKCTTAGAVTLTFTSQADGLSGSIIFVNSSNHTVSAHANTKLTAADLSKLSATGTYRIDYLSDGTNAYCSVVGAY